LVANTSRSFRPFLLSSSGKAIISGLLMFCCLAAWSFSSPISAGLDSTQHLATIWCANGQIAGMCEDIRYVDSDLVANIPYIDAGKPVNSDGTQTFQITSTSEQNLFYKFMNLFVQKNATKSILLMRLFNSVLFSFICIFLFRLKQQKFRIAAVAAFTFTLVPILISTISQVNPRSWAIISVMSSWLFLGAAIEGTYRKDRVLNFSLFLLTVLLAISSRWDAALFVLFTTSIVILRNFIVSKSLNVRELSIRVSGFFILFFIVRQFVPALLSRTSFQFFNSYPKGQFLFFQLVHIPENVADGLGLGIRYFDIGPNVIGIIGVSLFSIALAFNLRGASNAAKLTSCLTLVFIFIIMFRMTAVWNQLVPPVGAYTASLLTFLLGISSVDTTNNSDVYGSKLWRVSFITLISYAHFLSFYSRLEWSTTPLGLRENIGTYANIDLNQGWWWNSSVSPIAVLILGSIAFSGWLIFTWYSIVGIHSESTNSTLTSLTP